MIHYHYSIGYLPYPAPSMSERFRLSKLSTFEQPQSTAITISYDENICKKLENICVRQCVSECDVMYPKLRILYSWIVLCVS